MAKRKQNKTDDGSDNDDGSDRSLVDVDFEFFDPNPQVDYLALKRLLSQLFQADAESLQINDLADLILSQPLVGTTVKCDGRESDPYAVLTVLNMHVHQKNPSIATIIAYALSKATANSSFHSALESLLGPSALASQNHVGFIFSERLINMPVEIMPHMYRMLTDEIQWAIDDNEPYTFTHFLIISRIYRLSPQEEHELQANTPRTKRPRQQSAVSSGVYSFHPEDECISKFATHTLAYDFTNAQPRGEDGFGLDVGGKMMLVPADRLKELVAALAETFPQPA